MGIAGSVPVFLIVSLPSEVPFGSDAVTKPGKEQNSTD